MTNSLLIVVILSLAILIYISFTKKLQLDFDIQESYRQLQNQFDRLNTHLKDEFQRNRKESNETAKDNREEMSKKLDQFKVSFDQNTQFLNHLIQKKLMDFETVQRALNEETEKRIKEIKLGIENQLKEIRDDNSNKLEEIRKTVDEKLQKTLNERLAQSFETVGKQLLAVQDGLGEMKTLASDVGGLKKVLSNVKMRGGLGEAQLEMLLEQILAPNQFEKNVQTKKNSAANVEFAIKLPGKNLDSTHIWLPIDAKFPKDIYEKLQEAHDIGTPELINTAQKELENTIKKMAKDISTKYINPPYTTDFAILFLPFEGIYAEVVRKASLLEELQRDYKIIVTGPTTLAAILNSLQMGFRTLAIEKRSSEVWQVLTEVKKEFNNFGGMMQKAQKHIQTGLNQLDHVMGARTNAIQRKLRDIEIIEDNKIPIPSPK